MDWWLEGTHKTLYSLQILLTLAKMVTQYGNIFYFGTNALQIQISHF